MTVEERCIYFTILTYKFINELASESFTNYFHKAGDVYTCTYATRFASNENLELPKPKTSYIKRSLLYRVASCWNSLPFDVKTSVCVFFILCMFYMFHKCFI